MSELSVIDDIINYLQECRALISNHQISKTLGEFILTLQVYIDDEEILPPDNENDIQDPYT